MLVSLNSVGTSYHWTNTSTQFNESKFSCKCYLWQAGICETHRETQIKVCMLRWNSTVCRQKARKWQNLILCGLRGTGFLYWICLSGEKNPNQPKNMYSQLCLPNFETWVTELTSTHSKPHAWMYMVRTMGRNQTSSYNEKLCRKAQHCIWIYQDDVTCNCVAVVDSPHE